MQTEENEKQTVKGKKWTNENILKEILNQSVDGICVSRDMALTVMARRRFGSWDEACKLAGVSSLRASRERYKECTIGGCNDRVRNETCQWCEKHYYRNRRNGDPNKLHLKQYVVNDEFFDYWTPQSAWLVGLLWTDGWLNGTSLGLKSKDEQLIVDVKRLLSTDVQTKIEKGKYYRISIASKRIVQKLKDFGMCENKSLVIGWPLSMTDDLKWHFIRGLLDGDGCVSKIKRRKNQNVADYRLFFATASIKLHQKLIEHLNVSHTVRIRQPFLMSSGNYSKPFYKIHVEKQSDLKKLIEQMYPTVDVPCLHRKRDLLLEFYNTPRVKGGRKINRESRTCGICSKTFSVISSSKKRCCDRICGHVLSWRSRKS